MGRNGTPLNFLKHWYAVELDALIKSVHWPKLMMWIVFEVQGVKHWKFHYFITRFLITDMKYRLFEINIFSYDHIE